jgi:hypothetical protein
MHIEYTEGSAESMRIIEQILLTCSWAAKLIVSAVPITS